MALKLRSVYYFIKDNKATRIFLWGKKNQPRFPTKRMKTSERQRSPPLRCASPWVSASQGTGRVLGPARQSVCCDVLLLLLLLLLFEECLRKRGPAWACAGGAAAPGATLQERRTEAPRSVPYPSVPPPPPRAGPALPRLGPCPQRVEHAALKSPSFRVLRSFVAILTPYFFSVKI